MSVLGFNVMSYIILILNFEKERYIQVFVVFLSEKFLLTFFRHVLSSFDSEIKLISDNHRAFIYTKNI